MELSIKEEIIVDGIINEIVKSKLEYNTEFYISQWETILPHNYIHVVKREINAYNEIAFDMYLPDQTFLYATPIFASEDIARAFKIIVLVMDFVHQLDETYGKSEYKELVSNALFKFQRNLVSFYFPEIKLQNIEDKAIVELGFCAFFLHILSIM